MEDVIIKTIVVSGFPGVGKSHLFRESTNLIVLDSDSSNFSWINKGIRHPNFPQNYIEHIKDNIGKAHIILVSSHKVVRDALRANNIEYVLVYPEKKLKDEYIRRYKDRGNGDDFMEMIASNWDNFINDIEAEEYPVKKILQHGEHLSDVIESGKPHPVMCNGPCTSESDDYCGMYMSNETCPACDAIKLKEKLIPYEGEKFMNPGNIVKVVNLLDDEDELKEYLGVEGVVIRKENIDGKHSLWVWFNPEIEIEFYSEELEFVR